MPARALIFTLFLLLSSCFQSGLSRRARLRHCRRAKCCPRAPLRRLPATPSEASRLCGPASPRAASAVPVRVALPPRPRRRALPICTRSSKHNLSRNDANYLPLRRTSFRPPAPLALHLPARRSLRSLCRREARHRLRVPRVQSPCRRLRRVGTSTPAWRARNAGSRAAAHERVLLHGDGTARRGSKRRGGLVGARLGGVGAVGGQCSGHEQRVAAVLLSLDVAVDVLDV